MKVIALLFVATGLGTGISLISESSRINSSKITPQIPTLSTPINPRIKQQYLELIQDFTIEGVEINPLIIADFSTPEWGCMGYAITEINITDAVECESIYPTSTKRKETWDPITNVNLQNKEFPEEWIRHYHGKDNTYAIRDYLSEDEIGDWYIYRRLGVLQDGSQVIQGVIGSDNFTGKWSRIFLLKPTITQIWDTDPVTNAFIPRQVVTLKLHGTHYGDIDPEQIVISGNRITFKSGEWKAGSFTERGTIDMWTD